MRFLFPHHFNTVRTNKQTNTHTHKQTNTQQSSFNNIDIKLICAVWRHQECVSKIIQSTDQRAIEINFNGAGHQMEHHPVFAKRGGLNAPSHNLQKPPLEVLSRCTHRVVNVSCLAPSRGLALVYYLLELYRIILMTSKLTNT